MAMTLPDSVFFTSTRRGLGDARFQALLAGQLDRLLLSARRRAESAADAEDLVQECCLRAWNSRSKLREAAAGYMSGCWRSSMV